MNVILTRSNLAAARAKAPRGGRGGVQSGGGGNESTVDDEGREAPPADTSPDPYVQRVYKLIPAEVTAGYIALLAGVGVLGGAPAADEPVAAGGTGVATRVDETIKWAPLAAIVIGTLWTVLALRAAGARHRPPVKPLKRQYVITVLAFWAWAASVSDPAVAFGWNIPAWILFFGIVLIPAVGAYLMTEVTEDD